MAMWNKGNLAKCKLSRRSKNKNFINHITVDDLPRWQNRKRTFMSSDVLCIRRYSHCHRWHNPIVLLSIELPICNMQWKKSAQSESAVLLATVGEDN